LLDSKVKVIRCIGFAVFLPLTKTLMN